MWDHSLNLNQREKQKNRKRDKSDVLKKVVRAKLTSTWEGGGVGGKKHTNKQFS